MTSQEPTPTPDRALPDAELPVAEPPAAELPDTELPDAEPRAAELPDAEPPVAELPDTELPDAETLDRIAEPATVRRAPRYAAFIRAGVLLGAVIGWLLAVLFPVAGDEPTAAVTAICAFTLACVGALAGAGLAVLADRRG
ncbi:hypothetical protein [Pengzhenrongella sicca]|uniref:Uncharacterized protein n=1 Tax=Pengzhenrongella sicca TaxID=2819238 RepID=A0A8A4ZF85_9MICO|nr:hypothetical protein [Pengzhenrongella sicca]QTE29669.1 hypothetical protein J4E96_00985 [Pengzhenrongella sicca]